MPLLLLFLAIPLIEITLFIQVGQFLSLGWILLIVVLTAVLGTWLVRRQGRGVLAQLQSRMQELQDPTEPLAHGAMILLAGAFLITPGFLTDAMGFLLLVPKVRETVFLWLRRRVVMQTSFSTGWTASTQRRPNRSTSADVIDGEAREIEPEPRRSQGPSGWTRD